jgi:DNA polymerase-4
VVQAASIDEFYLDLSGTERLFQGESLAQTADRIRRQVLDETGIRVSVGGGTNRLVAKLAVSRAKPAGVFVVEAGREGDFLRSHDLADLPGVGPSLADDLRKRGLVTVEDALPVQLDWLQRWLGEGRGRWLHDRIRGRDPAPVNPREPRKSISSERTFSTDLREERGLERELLRQVVSVGQTLREAGLRARTVVVKIRYHDFTTRQRGHTLPEAVESDAALGSVARGLLAALLRRRRSPVRLLGVGVSSLEPRDAPDQLPLFDEAGRTETERDRTVSRLMDDLRNRFGDDALVPGRIVEE